MRDEGRNTLAGPGIVDFDAAIYKEFHMPYNENHVLQIRFEAFNALNHTNWTNPFASLSNKALFGRILGTSTSMRQLQFAAKYSSSSRRHGPDNREFQLALKTCSDSRLENPQPERNTGKDLLACQKTDRVIVWRRSVTQEGGECYSYWRLRHVVLQFS
ncbi:MAG TPA: hypothetical protein VGY31_00785 [Terriglobia bacterium]|nr:hypothetical protein [Terriglobia bacterium]